MSAGDQQPVLSSSSITSSVSISGLGGGPSVLDPGATPRDQVIITPPMPSHKEADHSEGKSPCTTRTVGSQTISFSANTFSSKTCTELLCSESLAQEQIYFEANYISS